MTAFRNNCFLATVLLCSILSIHAQTTAISYQGKLNAGTGPASGNYDMTFSVWNASAGGALIGGPITNNSVVVNNGVFSLSLDFGADVFNGASSWLEIAVRTNGGGSFTTLSPRQAVLATPYSLLANKASNLTGLLPANQLGGTIAPAQLPSVMLTNAQTGVNLSGTFSGNGAGLTALNAANLVGTLGASNIATAQVVKSINSLKDNVTFVAGSNISLNTNANSIQISATPAGSPTPNSIFPRFAWLNGGGSVPSVIVDTNGPGYIQQLDWGVFQYEPLGSNYICCHYVSITIDNDSPQYLYLLNAADTGYHNVTEKIPVLDQSSSNLVGYNYGWYGRVVFFQKLTFANHLHIECYFPSPTQGASGGGNLSPVPNTSGFFRVMYMLGQ